MTAADNAQPNPSHPFWDLGDTVSFDDAVALWSRIPTEEVVSVRCRHEGFQTKRAALISALRDGHLEFEDVGWVTSYGSRRLYDLPLDDLVESGRVVIKKPGLLRWLEQIGLDGQPADEPSQSTAPDSNDAGEMTSRIAIAVLAHLVAELAPGDYTVAGRPNAAQISVAVEARAKEWFGPDVRGFASFRKKLASALRQVELELPDRKWH